MNRHPVVIAASGLLAVAATARAGDVCNLNVAGLPDLDQRRSAAPGIPGLPGGGSQYCVPACTMNLMNFMANRGYPELMPGPISAAAPANYNIFTQALADMGGMMQTDPAGGTGSAGAEQGSTEWIADSGLAGDITTTAFYTTSTDAPEIGDFALALLVRQPTSVIVGWYQGPPIGQVGPTVRQSGHCVSLTGLPGFCTPNQQRMRFRDPISGDAQTLQSAPATTDRIATPWSASFVIGTQPNQVSYAGPLIRLNLYTSGASQGYVDGMRTFYPKFGLTSPPCCPTDLSARMPRPFPGGPLGVNNSFAAGGVGPLIDADIHPNLAEALVVVAGDRTSGAPASLRRLNMGTGTSEPVAMPSTVPSPPRRVVCGESWRECYLLLDDPPSALARIRLDGSAASLFTAPGPIDEIAFDPTTRGLVALSGSNVLKFDLASGGGGGGAGTWSTHALPAGVVPGADARIAVDPRSGRVLLPVAGPAGTGIGVLSTTAAGGLTLDTIVADAALTAPVGIDCDDAGRVFTSQAGAVLEFEPVPGGGYARKEATSFADWSVGRFLRISRSRTNRLPAHDSPEMTLNSPPDPGPQFLDCPGDFNADGVLGPQDIFDFLAAYFAGNPAADVNNSGGLSVQDIFDFLEAYFRGCE